MRGARKKEVGMRPIWKGHISFGLVNVPVTLYPAEQRTELSFHMIDSRNVARVRYQRVNAESGEEVAWDDIVKGYEYEDGSYVLISQEELERLSPEATRAVNIEAFVDLSEIDLTYFDKPYYLEPAKGGEKGYALLREALRESGKAGIARVVLRTRQYIAAMVPRDEALVLVLLRYQEELRSIDALKLPGDPEEIGTTKQELKMARMLVDSMTTKWDAAAYRDEYSEALMKWINTRIKAGQIERAPELPEPADEAPAPINLMEALKKSLSHTEKPAKKPAAKPSGKKQTKKKAG
jgi:DNA end-binding protein Ku